MSIDLNRKWMKEIQKLFLTKDPNNNGLSTGKIQEGMREAGAGSGQTAGAIDTALEIGLLSRIGYGQYKLVQADNSQNINEVINNILDNAKKEIDTKLPPSILNTENFEKVKKVIDNLNNCKL